MAGGSLCREVMERERGEALSDPGLFLLNSDRTALQKAIRKIVIAKKQAPGAWFKNPALFRPCQELLKQTKCEKQLIRSG